MKIFAKNAARPWGFTLVELLTVVAIIGVLATLLASSLGAAKRKARKTVSIGNLHQIALAFNLYQDDHRGRPSNFTPIVVGKYLTQRSLACPEDRWDGNWAGIIEDNQNPEFSSPNFASRTPISPSSEVPHSYFRSFDAPAEIWDRIEKDPLAGIVACQLHGLGSQNRDIPPSLMAYQGLVLRGLKDTTVLARQVYWNDNVVDKAGPSIDGPSTAFFPETPSASDLPLFLDAQP